jgi:hypothetical protein
MLGMVSIDGRLSETYSSFHLQLLTMFMCLQDQLSAYLDVHPEK